MKMKKYLILFGLIWIILWCLTGLYHGIIHESYAEIMLRFAKKGDLVNYWQTWRDWKWNSTVHSHGISFSFLVIFLGHIWPDIKLSEKIKNISGVSAIIGIAMAGIFGTLNILFLDGIGDLLLLGAFMVCTFGYFRGLKHT
ncbi:MAG: hypothetical protein GY714_06260 [Desulfobacterales bacterium]|nr:hypothetical protein [Desulfobacterales bacterium]